MDTVDKAALHQTEMIAMFQVITSISHKFVTTPLNAKTSIQTVLLLALGFLTLIVLLQFLFVNKQKSSLHTDWLVYTNTDLGISFGYPPTFKVYHTGPDRLRIDSAYKHPVHHGIEVSMTIEKIASRRWGVDELKSHVRPMLTAPLPEEYSEKLRNQKFIVQSKGPYDLVQVEDVRLYYYVLSVQGTFQITDTLDLWKSDLQETGVFADYRSTFDSIVYSIEVF